MGTVLLLPPLHYVRFREGNACKCQLALHLAMSNRKPTLKFIVLRSQEVWKWTVAGVISGTPFGKVSWLFPQSQNIAAVVPAITPVFTARSGEQPD